MHLSQAEKAEFLIRSGWEGATETRVGEDWSQRKVSRVEKNGKTAILMHSLPDDHPLATPGHKLLDFNRISSYLTSIGLSAPRIYAEDIAHGLLLVEDFGTASLESRISESPDIEMDDYLMATGVLSHIYGRTQHIAINLPDYQASHIHAGRRRIVDWYFPAVRKTKNPDGLVEEYLMMWKKIEGHAPPAPRRFLHADFHPGNLMWLPGRVREKKIGLLDFQGALVGPAPYDLVNLLEDARRIVPGGIKTTCLMYFTQGLMTAEKEGFQAWYPILACQFHCRVIGQAIKLAIREGKPRLLSLLPILLHHLREDMKHPVLAPMARWFKIQGITFGEPPPEIVPGTLAKLIREDAF